MGFIPLPSQPRVLLGGTNPSVCAEDPLCKKARKVKRRGVAALKCSETEVFHFSPVTCHLSSRLQTVFSRVPDMQNLKRLNFVRVLEFFQVLNFFQTVFY